MIFGDEDIASFFFYTPFKNGKTKFFMLHITWMLWCKLSVQSYEINCLIIKTIFFQAN